MPSDPFLINCDDAGPIHGAAEMTPAFSLWGKDTMWSKALVILSALALMACQQDAEPVTGSASASPASMAASPFDGTYQGRMTLTRDELGNCGTAGNRTLEVRQGQGSLLFNPDRGLRAAGPVAPDGSFSLAGQIRDPVVITGKIENGIARATFSSRSRSASCGYDLELRKAG